MSYCVGDRLLPGYHLEAPYYMESANGEYIAKVEHGESFVVYAKLFDDRGFDFCQKQIFATGGAINTSRLRLRKNGRITLINPSHPEKPEWNSKNDADGEESFLVLQGDGDLVAYKVCNGMHIQDPGNIDFPTLKKMTVYRTFAVHNLDYVN